MLSQNRRKQSPPLVAGRRQRRPRKAATQQSAAEGGGGSDAKVQHEKAAANVDHIRKLRSELEMEYVKALYTAFDKERKLEEISTIGSTSSTAPLLQYFF